MHSLASNKQDGMRADRYLPNWQVHSAANAPYQCITTKLKQLGRGHQHVVYVHGVFRGEAKVVFQI
jgi:hypothetical protein